MFQMSPFYLFSLSSLSNCILLWAWSSKPSMDSCKHCIKPCINSTRLYSNWLVSVNLRNPALSYALASRLLLGQAVDLGFFGLSWWRAQAGRQVRVHEDGSCAELGALLYRSTLAPHWVHGVQSAAGRVPLLLFIHALSQELELSLWIVQE